MTKKQIGMLENYRSATATNLWDVYTTFSKAKRNAYDYCRRVQYEMHGTAGRICSANTYQFTYAFTYVNDNGKESLCYITPSNNYTFEIEG